MRVTCAGVNVRQRIEKKPTTTSAAVQLQQQNIEKGHGNLYVSVYMYWNSVYSVESVKESMPLHTESVEAKENGIEFNFMKADMSSTCV